MEIVKKIAKKTKDLSGTKIPTIAFLGDSVTQGCFECYIDENGVATAFDKNSAYHNYLAKIFEILYPGTPINIINAGISGGNTTTGYERIERDVLALNPDLTVVCFGLNDSWGGMDGIPKYRDNLRKIFNALKDNGSEVIFMTANMMNTKVSHNLKEEDLRGIAAGCMQTQNEGVLEAYFEGAREVAKECGVTVCDVYTKWKTLYENGVNTTELLSNYINHPTREMNWLFAYSLVECMFQN